MYRIEELPGPAPLTHAPLTLPVDVLLGLPDPASPHFNLIGAMGRLLNKFSWNRATHILAPRLWAPGWPDDVLEAFLRAPFQGEPHTFPGEDLLTLQALDFMGLDTPELALAPAAQQNAFYALLADYNPQLETLNLAAYGRAAPIYRPQYDVVHLFTAFEAEGRLVLGPAQHLSGDVLLDLLLWAETRLVILHLPYADLFQGEAMARRFIEKGVPAALVVGGDHPSAIDAYYADLYAGIVHNQRLEDIARPKGDSAALDVVLVHAPGTGQVLQFHVWLDQLRERFTKLRAASRAQRTHLDALRSRAQNTLPKQQREAFEDHLHNLPIDLDRLHDEIEGSTDLLYGDLDWAHESGGAEPLSRIAETVSDLEAHRNTLDAYYASLEQKLEAMEGSPTRGGDPQATNGGGTASPGPPLARVLNAFFARTETGAVLDAHTSLHAAQEHALLVDIGLPRKENIATGLTTFPEEHLPAQSGYDVEVVLVSEDLSPGTVAGRMWVPAENGRSVPYINGKKAAKPGPLALRFTAPALPDGAGPRRLHGRLCLYFENNLLQAAAVSATVTQDGAADLETPTEIFVDYRLSASLKDVSARYARRRVRFTDADAEAYPVALNITLNDAGGRHRILVKDHTEMAPAWAAYDPDDAKADLERGRTELLACFNGLKKENNSKSFKEFCLDLHRLALIGNDLFKKFKLQVQPTDQGLQRAWIARLRQTLAQGGVIQAARAASTPAQYIIPWALFYDYPLEGGPLKWCEVLEGEWVNKDRRDLPMAAACPYQDEPWHQKQVLCPYGFWGLKHIVEQPLAALHSTNGTAVLRDVDAVHEIVVQGDISLAMAQTTDPKVDQHALAQHLARMGTLNHVRRAQPNPNPATDGPGLEKLLEDAAFVYMLCHGEYDPVQKEPFIGVGLRDGQLRHKIYTGTVLSWADTGLTSWLTQRPLVFINGCQTSALKPGEVFNLISAFSYAGAGAVVGTEVSVEARLAMAVAEDLAAQMAQGVPLGQAMRQVRWTLANKGNLLGLAYTAYGLADLHFTQV